jgi:hypothetical protein
MKFQLKKKPRKNESIKKDLSLSFTLSLSLKWNGDIAFPPPELFKGKQEKGHGDLVGQTPVLVLGYLFRLQSVNDKRNPDQRIIPISEKFSRDDLSGYCTIGFR